MSPRAARIKLASRANLDEAHAERAMTNTSANTADIRRDMIYLHQSGTIIVADDLQNVKRRGGAVECIRELSGVLRCYL